MSRPAADHRHPDLVANEPEARALVERRLAAVGRLAGALAHDFNNLLTAVLGYTDLLLDELEPSHAWRSDLLAIRRSGDRAATLTRLLLAFNRGGVSAPQHVCWETLTEELRPMLAGLLGERISLELEAAPAPDVLARKSDASHVLFALALAAPAVLPDGGVCSVRVGQGLAASGRAGCEVAVCLRQSAGHAGPLVLSDAVLAEVRGLIASQNATMEVVDGSGTVEVRLSFPPTDDFEPMALREGAPAPRRAQVSVLLAEDDDMLRGVARRLLERDGFEVVAAASGPEALSALERRPEGIDVLVTDVVMPGMTGVALAREVIRRLPAVRVLFVSGYSDAPTLDLEGLPAPCGFLSKPFTGEQLGGALRQLERSTLR